MWDGHDAKRIHRKRYMINRKVWLAGCSILFLATVAIACGPYFPLAFLPHRDAVLKAPIEGSFAFEMGRYPSALRLGTIEPKRGLDNSLEAGETKDVTPEQHSLIQRMRKAKDGDEAYSMGRGLPEAIRLYTAAAVDYHLARKPDTFELLAPTALVYRAIKRFEAVLSMPHRDRMPRATWAAYSLAETYLHFKLEGRYTKANEYYERVRLLAKQGNPDRLNLGWFSLGQQALLKLRAGDTATAVNLYLEQGDVISLRLVAQRLVLRPDKFRLELKAQPVRRLLIAYAFSFGQSSPDTGKQPAWLGPLTKALLTSSTRDIENADRLAALSYQGGNYQYAAQLAERSETPLAYWVKSKLARRGGDRSLAAVYMAKATADRQTISNTMSDGLRDRLNLENAVVVLETKGPVQSIAKMYAMGSKRWPDIAYIAERLLTTEELRVFVDSIPESTEKAEPSFDKSNALTDSFGKHLDGDELAAQFGYRSTSRITTALKPLDRAYQIRNLTARRLMREGRYKTALRYFATSDLQTINYAREYGEALRLSRHAKDRTAKAELLFKAGLLAREHGMDILGYELAPDFYYAAGNYDAYSILGFKESEGPSPLIYGKAAMSAEEAARFDATAPIFDKRFHYRYLAVKHARGSAALVPRRSQAYRAILCHATSWAPSWALKDDLYRTYLENGSFMNNPLAGFFGGKCETPAFERAYRLHKSYGR